MMVEMMQVLKVIYRDPPGRRWSKMMEQEVFATLGARRRVREDFLQKERLELGGMSLGEQDREGVPSREIDEDPEARLSRKQ